MLHISACCRFLLIIDADVDTAILFSYVTRVTPLPPYALIAPPMYSVLCRYAA